MSQHSNTPGLSSESTEKKKKVSGNQMESLLQDSIYREFRNPFDPQRFDAYKIQRDSYNERIRTHMRDLCRENMEDWAEVTHDMIDSYARDTEINERIVRMSKKLILMRKNTYNRALETFPTIKNQGDDWSAHLQRKLAELNENELSNLATSTVSMRKFIHKIFPELKGQNPSEIRDFDRIFSDKNEYLHDDFLKKEFSRIHKNYYQYHQAPSSEDVDFILGAYASADNNRKKKLLTELGISLSLEDAFDTGLIDEVFLRHLATEEFGDAYNGLDKNQQDSFVRGLQKDQTIAISAADFNENKLGEIFSSEKGRKKITQGICRTMSIDMPASDGVDTIAKQIRKEKQRQAKESGTEEMDYDVYKEFIERLNKKFSGKVTGINLLNTENPVIRFQDPQSGTQYMRVKESGGDHVPLEIRNGTDIGVRFEGLPMAGGNLQKGGEFELSYEEFERFFETQKDITILKKEDFDDLLADTPEEAKKEGKIYNASKLEDEGVTKENIAAKLDLIDSEGQSFDFKKGTCFIAPSTDEKGKADDADVWMVQGIHTDSQGEGRIDLMDSGGREEVKGFPLVEFYDIIKSAGTFKRIASIQDDSEMLKELQEFGLDEDTKLKNGKLILEEHDSHGDNHSHGHAKEKEITCFDSKNGGHIRVGLIQDNKVQFGEYSSDTDVKKAREYAEKKGLKPDELKRLYIWKTMSYPAFLKYLEKNKLQATTKDLVVPEAAHEHHGDHHHEHAHMDGSFLKRIMKWQNPASIWKGFEMIFHSIEHTLEKGAKLDAARFAMQTSRFLNLPASVTAQVYSDIVNESKQIVEKYENKIFGLPGPAGRDKCIHIVHDKDSRPEEVMSAINYMLKSYGHLYAEDIKHYQSKVTPHNIQTADPGYFAFLDGFIITSKLPGGLIEWRNKAYKKAIGEMGGEEDHEGEPTEEQLIHAILKTVDGNWDSYPYAASVVKATGGPSGFEKNWKFEGFDNAYKKGKDQTQMVNAQGRLNKAVGYFNTHEIYKAIGSMEMVAAKVKDSEYQAMPFIWAVGGYSKHASHTALQKLKVYAEQGMTFHAYAFLRNKINNDIYRETVRMALKQLAKDKKIDSEAVDEFNQICDRLEHGPEDTKVTDSKYKKKSPAVAMMEFWQKYQGKGLHDMLQGQDGWLTNVARNGDKETKGKAQAYLGVIHGAHGMALKDNAIPGMEFGNDWFKEHGYANIILAPGPNGLNSLSSMLNKIQFEGTSPGAKPMNQEHREKIWNYIRKYMTGPLRHEYGDAKLQREQYLYHRQEILQYFAEKLTAHGIRAREANADKIIETNIRTFPYYRDLAEMGIDPHAVFDDSLEHKNAGDDYNRWKSGSIAPTSYVSLSVPNVEDMVRGKSHTVIDRDENSIVVANAGPRMKRDDWKPSGKKSWESEWTDDDKLYSGGVSDIVGDHDESGESNGAHH